ncbi:MAG: VWA domain-containing protein [Candidatus Krumholzibacteriia bacterium]
MRFAADIWLLAVPAVLGLWLVLRVGDRRARGRLSRLMSRRADDHVEASAPRLAAWRRFLLLTALVWIAVGLARPQWGAREVTVTQKGTDIVVALDVSNSMLAEDVTPNRLVRARAELDRFLAKQEHSRVAVVLFAGAAFVQCPLTLDYGTARLFLGMADTDMISEQGTALASALGVSRELLTHAGSRGEAFRAVVLVTDGEDLEGAWREEAERCAGAGIVIIPVGVGEETGGLIPVRDAQGRPDGFLKDSDGSVVMTRLDRAALDELARIGGSSSFRIGNDGLAGDRLRAVLDGLGKRDLEDRRISAYQDRYEWFLGVAMICLVLRLVLRPRRRDHAGRLVGPGSERLQVGAAAAEPRTGGTFGARLPRPSGTAAAAATVLVPGFLLASILGSGSALAQPLRPAGSAHAAEGIRLYHAESFPEALQRFEAARAEAPDDPRLTLAVGETLHRLGRHDEAVREFRRALTLAGSDELRAESLYNAGTTQLAAGELAEAVDLLRESLRLQPGRDDALHNLELALLALEQQERQQDQQPDQQQQDQQPDNQQDDQQEPGDQDDQPRQGDDQQQGDRDEQQDGEREREDQRQNDQPEDQPAEQDEQPAPEPPADPQEPEAAPEEGEPVPQDGPEELTEEQARQLLRALDRDEQELKRAVQRRLKGTPTKSGKRW